MKIIFNAEDIKEALRRFVERKVDLACTPYAHPTVANIEVDTDDNGDVCGIVTLPEKRMKIDDKA